MVGVQRARSRVSESVAQPPMPPIVSLSVKVQG
jgi:hypothetical protein